MRRPLLVSAAFLGVAVCMAPPARAVLPVTDVASITARALEAAKNIAQLIAQYGLMEQQYQEMILTFNAVSHGNNVLSTAQGLLSRATQLPGSSYTQMPGLTFGSQSSAGAVQFFAQNHFYTPQGTDFEAQEIQRQQQATANIQAEAYAGMQRADQRVASLQELQANIQDQPDVTAVSAVEAHIQSEQAFLANETTNVQRLQLMEATQSRVDQEREEQAGRKDAEEWGAAEAAAAFGE